MATSVSRRGFFRSAGVAGAAAALGTAAQAAAIEKPYQGGASPWPLVLNASTIRPTPLLDKIRVAAEAGYDGIELWVNELEEYEKGGGDLKALGGEIRDRGLFVPNIIGLWSCMPATQEEWEASLPATRERMRMAAAVGSQHAAAIPAPDREDFDIHWGAQRYRDLLKIGREEYNLIVAVEFVGFMKGIHRLGQASAIALDANDPDACLVADTFHLYRGGTGFESIRHLDGEFIAVFHWNDVPDTPPREEMGDEHRVYPTDGILPLGDVAKQLVEIGYKGPLSLELFNRPQWEQDPAVVAATGLEKMKASIAPALT